MKQFPSLSFSREKIESRLMWLAALFMFCFCLILTLSPAARFRSWQVEYRFDHWAGFAIWALAFYLIYGQLNRFLPERDPFLLPIGALLSGWGLLTIWRLDSVFGLRQSLWLVISLFAFWFGLKTKDFLPLLLRYKYIWLISGLLLTALTFFFGTYPAGEGPHLWLGCCGVYFQPSEPLKLLMVTYLAAYLADQFPAAPNLPRLLAPTLILFGAALAVLLAQRDLGTASIFILLYFAIIFLVIGRRRFLIVSVPALLISGYLGYRIFPIIQARLDGWLNPWVDPDGRSYQVVQSLIAVATGSVFGRGIGIGNPSVVPVAISDFIFSVMSEETGLVGTLALILLLALILWRGFSISLHASNHYKRYLAAGLTIYLLLQSILIIAGNLRLLPLTGVTLPFVSYGGSSLLTSFLTLLILILVSSQPEEEPAPLSGTQPYDLLQTGLLVVLAIIALANGYWAFIQSGDLQLRHDNPRLYISDLYVPRGEILDRNNQPITITTGEPGSYTRYTNYPPLGPVTGYSSPIYGQAGLEFTLDPYLRGMKGNTAFNLWINHLLYGESPPGLNVRLSLDLGLQRLADDMLANHTGSIILMNAHSGEILAMASHPFFDPNRLEENWSEWVKQDHAHLLNRATLGNYPPGAALGPFLLATAIQDKRLDAVPANLPYLYKGNQWDCALSPPITSDWGSMITNGCPGIVFDLYQKVTPNRTLELLHSLHMDQSPETDLSVAQANPINLTEPQELLNPASKDFLVSPLQMALAASALTSRGELPSPHLGMAVQSPTEGWVILNNTEPIPVLPTDSTITAMQMLSDGTLPVWDNLAVTRSQDSDVTWYIGGTTPDWKGSPLALVVVLEEKNPITARQIGHEIIKNTIELK